MPTMQFRRSHDVERPTFRRSRRGNGAQLSLRWSPGYVEVVDGKEFYPAMTRGECYDHAANNGCVAKFLK